MDLQPRPGEATPKPKRQRMRRMTPGARALFRGRKWALGQGWGALALAVPTSLLPARWRKRVVVPLPWAAGTVLCGICQVVAAMLIGASGYRQLWETLANPGAADPTRIYSYFSAWDSLAIWFTFLFSPPGLLMVIYLVEGVLRASLALGTGRAFGTGSLWLLAQLEKPALALHRRRRPPQSR